jgi:hypothetical protein
VSYRVYRGEVGQVAAVPVHLTVSAADAAAAGQSPAGTLALMVDPYFPITKIASPIYWVDAIFANGSMSGLSPNATLSPPSILGPPQFGPKNLTAMIGPQMTLPGDPQPVRNVTWNWDPTFLVLYEVDVFFVGSPGVLGPSYTTVRMETLLSAHGPFDPTTNSVLPGWLSPFTSKGYAAGPPYTFAVPSGTLVGFCVGAGRDPGKPIYQPGAVTSCITTQVP